MRRLILIALAAVAAYYAYTQQFQRSELAGQTSSVEATVSADSPGAQASASSDALQRAFDNQQSNLQIEMAGTVDRLLSDDNEGSRHQRFIVKLASGQSVLVAHNIDLAPRVASLAVGDHVVVYGEYEWNDKGGVMHWTHHDPAGRHVAGWIKHQGNTYQ